MKLRQSWKLVSLLVILAVIGVVAAVNLFDQRQPAVPVAGTITRKCDPTSPTPVNVTLGGSGQMTFSCNSSAPTTNPAFTTGGPVIATPLITGFVAPYNSSRLYIYTANGAVTTGICSSRTGNQKIESGISETMPLNSWNYCADYENVGQAGLPEFTVTWTVG